MLWEENRLTAYCVFVTRLKLKWQTQYWATNFGTRVWWRPPLLCICRRDFQFLHSMVWNNHCTFFFFFLELIPRFICFLPSQIARPFCLRQHKHIFRPLVQFKFINFRFLFRAYLNLIGVLRCCCNAGLCYCCSAVTPSRQHSQTAFKALCASRVGGETKVTVVKKTYTDTLIIINQNKVTILQQL